MTRREILQLRRGALLTLKALYVGTLNHQTMELVLPTQIQAAAALHQACCWEWEDSWNGIDVDGLVGHLQAIEGELMLLPVIENRETLARGIDRALFTLRNLINGLQDDEPDDGDDAEGGS